ncbi:MAG: rod shape-determining protein MreC [Gemmatimonadaceae bacterium]
MRAARYGGRADTVVLIACVAFAFIARGLPLEVRGPIASVMRRTVVAPLVSLQESAELTRGALATHEARTVARDSVAVRAMQLGSVQAENERLRELLGLGGELRWGFVPAEALHTRGIGEEFTLTLTAGANAGVAPFSPVVAPEGLVGMVQAVDPTMSTALIWPHPDFRASAMAADGSAFGIIAAHLGEGPERYLLEMRGVPFRSELAPGTMIVTSGLGGVYPRGIPIGTVLADIDTPQGWARTYLVRPAVLPPDVASVMVLQPARVAEGVESVWLGAAGADSAARRIAAASDSAARTAALEEAEARRAAIARAQSDSVADVAAPTTTNPPVAARRTPSQVAAPVIPQDSAPPPPPRRVQPPVITGPPSPVPQRIRDPRFAAPPPPVRAPAVRDTTPPPRTRADSARADTVRTDTVPPDTVPPDTVRRPPGAG